MDPGDAVVSKTDTVCSLGTHILGEGVGGGEKRKEGDLCSEKESRREEKEEPQGQRE